jgi:DNA-binding XRE family transcriptional regulator
VSALREARTGAGLSQEALAAAAGVSRQAVGAIEAGRHRPSVDAALAIAAAVGRSVEELFAAPDTS